MAERRVVLAGGGTAGHVNPLLALAAELRRRDPGTRLVALGTAEGLESTLVPAAGIDLVTVPRVPLPRRPSADVLRFPGRWRRAVAVAAEAIAADGGADAVVGFGGYVATPAYIAARRAGVPVVVHEQNARPGLANRLGARRAAEVGVTFPGTRLPGATVTGLPLRPAIADLVAAREDDAAAARRAGAEALGLDPSRPVLLVTGGSLGAARVNAAVAGAAAEVLATGAQVLHLTGAGKDEDTRRDLARALGAQAHPDYHVLAYLEQMQHALACADLVVGRAGAGTVCELAALGIPAVYVPLPIGNGEQRLNAAGVVEAGGGLLVADEDLTPAWVVATVVPLLADPGRLAGMGERAAGAGVRDGAARLADLVARAIGEGR
ncbi:MAG TPA: UDP-N-acetylglucosamine--N-acetylmuramyl-(pentapeptide) pyrophosphoryl-undecaprenol N-acetylglucosamine transferase [Actinotalea caeni]|uniref:UDP-N-acetylglucosamine--N-acetylmuramyl- (pentapeptide) pyrophosphoryl-undecaprenol N-acetylglucosamine transferase n=1 Tax=Actinotalea caeni TaxID=1348467 RepID=UPI002B4ACBA0|nr:UDP-N-acetylglucosamine--N-acetylmuramyl-(pentapeptide) pyrophosphoryl-undecaprenol N-acetylglucosamine transferase [Actinotalea caeni]HLV56640.1 UDP-N-acetylglucosamine--N-acetylmuramyl-(pentapeptide) pyrophosphoryl-undecaprenol N-acetylglucosamine transferase [Actinotalea caeni]